MTNNTYFRVTSPDRQVTTSKFKPIRIKVNRPASGWRIFSALAFCSFEVFRCLRVIQSLRWLVMDAQQSHRLQTILVVSFYVYILASLKKCVIFQTWDSSSFCATKVPNLWVWLRSLSTKIVMKINYYVTFHDHDA